MLVVKDIRKLFRDEYKLNKTRNGTVELQGVSFKADEDYICLAKRSFKNKL